MGLTFLDMPHHCGLSGKPFSVPPDSNWKCCVLFLMFVLVFHWSSRNTSLRSKWIQQQQWFRFLGLLMGWNFFEMPETDSTATVVSTVGFTYGFDIFWNAGNGFGSNSSFDFWVYLWVWHFLEMPETDSTATVVSIFGFTYGFDIFLKYQKRIHQHQWFRNFGFTYGFWNFLKYQKRIHRQQWFRIFGFTYGFDILWKTRNGFIGNSDFEFLGLLMGLTFYERPETDSTQQ